MGDFTWIEVGRRLKDWRQASGLTQRELAIKVGLSQPAIQAIEAGTGNPQLNSLQLLASALRRTTRELVCGQELLDDARVHRLERIVSSGHPLAIAAADQGLACAEAILDPTSFPRSLGTGRRGLRRVLSQEESDRAKDAFPDLEKGQPADIPMVFAGKSLSGTGFKSETEMEPESDLRRQFPVISNRRQREAERSKPASMGVKQLDSSK